MTKAVRFWAGASWRDRVGYVCLLLAIGALVALPWAGVAWLAVLAWVLLLLFLSVCLLGMTQPFSPGATVFAVVMALVLFIGSLLSLGERWNSTTCPRERWLTSKPGKATQVPQSIDCTMRR